MHIVLVFLVSGVSATLNFSISGDKMNVWNHLKNKNIQLEFNSIDYELKYVSINRIYITI